VDLSKAGVINKSADNIAEGTTRKWAGESGADITGSHQAATIAGQGALATKGSVDLSTTEVTNKSADHIAEGTTRKWAGESGADITGSHQAATIAGQGALATKSSVDLATGEVTNKNLDNVADGSTYARTTPNQRDGGGRGYNALTSANKVYPGAFADSNPGMVTGQAQIADGTTDDESGYWVPVATVDFQVPGNCASMQFTLAPSLGGGTAGPVVLYTSGDNIGIAIYTGTTPNDPTVSRYGTGVVTYPTPSGTKLTVYLKGKPGTREYIEGKCSQDVVTPLRSGYVL
jgi:hypothetical protein